MNKSSGTAEHDELRAYRASEPQRARDPFANPILRTEITRIAEARAERAANGWRSQLFGWVSAAPRGALAAAALSAVILIGGAAGQVVGGQESAARLEAGAVPLASSLVPMASADANAASGESDRAEMEEVNEAAIAYGAALLLLSGSLAAVFITVRRRRA